MSLRYRVGDFFVDPSRNQITLNEQPQTIPPKALAVLTYLAKNPGKVVSQNELLDNIWPDTVVTPNTLQRSIAQLRKAFGDDRKSQAYIKTHAKQGYSLECEVSWHQELESQQLIEAAEEAMSAEPEPALEPLESNELNDEVKSNEVSESQQLQVKTPKPNLVLPIIIVLLIVVAVIGYSLNSPKPDTELVFDKIQTLTTTDHKEFGPSYSPDGNYIIFHRYRDKLCSNRVWARNIHTQKESLITKEWGTYSSHTLSPDGKNLVFISQEGCSQAETQNMCYDLVSIDFQQALVSPQDPSVMLRCQNSRIRSPFWLDDNNIAILQNMTNRWSLMNYSTVDNSSQALYQRDDRNIVSFDYSREQDLFAITSIREDSKQYIDMLTTSGEVISSHPIELPKEVPANRNIYPRFSPLTDLLIFSTGKQIFTLSYTGQVSKIGLPLDKPISTPQFHLNGQRAVIIKGLWDGDIAKISLNEVKNSSNIAGTEVTDVYQSIARSTMSDDEAIYQPDGDLIAFRSRRSGEEQVWLIDGENLRQITQLPLDTSIGGVVWAKDGQSLLISANKQLKRVFLDSRIENIATANPVIQLFQWDSEANTVLATVRIKEQVKFAEINLATNNVNVIKGYNINWAQKTVDGQLIYMDKMKRYWQPGPMEDVLIEKLAGQGSDKRFLVQNNLIYGINDDNQLWLYNLDTDDFELLGEMHRDIDFLSDIRQENLLFTFVVSAKKEIAELFLRE